jgi:hypothetical protein
VRLLAYKLRCAAVLSEPLHTRTAKSTALAGFALGRDHDLGRLDDPRPAPSKFERSNRMGGCSFQMCRNFSAMNARRANQVRPPQTTGRLPARDRWLDYSPPGDDSDLSDLTGIQDSRCRSDLRRVRILRSQPADPLDTPVPGCMKASMGNLEGRSEQHCTGKGRRQRPSGDVRCRPDCASVTWPRREQLRPT